VLLSGPCAISSATIYDNTATDALISYFYSAYPVTEIGDRVTFGGTERYLTGASVEFFIRGTGAGTFSAIMQLYQNGSPAGATIGAPVQVNGLAIARSGFLVVDFAFPELLVPDTVVFGVSMSNVVGALDPGLNAYRGPSGSGGAPAIGASNLAEVFTGTPLSRRPTSATVGNLYFRATANAASLLTLIALRRRR
jgi:hypothetical protein